MQFQISTDFAIRILMYLHENRYEVEPHTAMNISKAVGMTYPFFIKIANQLKKANLIHAIQGRNGGYKLPEGKPANQISVYDVFVAVEGDNRKISHCMKTGAKPCTNNHDGDCKLRKFLHGLQENALFAPMSKMMISDLVDPVEDEAEAAARLARISALEEEIQRLKRHHNRKFHETGSVTSTDVRAVQSVMVCHTV